MYLFILLVFVLGYMIITLEHAVKINKAATALLTGSLCWTLYAVGAKDVTIVTAELAHQLSEIAEILFFLMGAMTIVELIDAHDGFEVITRRITTNDKRTLLWISGVITFFLSAVLDNLTTAIVMVSLMRKLLKEKNERMLFLGLIVIAANAGGAWSPIGDVTTTMLWIGRQITASNIVVKLFLPSFICLLVPLVMLSFVLKGKFERPAAVTDKISVTSAFHRNLIFACGLIVLLLVPVFKVLTHLPPYMGMLLGLAILWIITELIHGDKDEDDKQPFSVVYALRKIDTPSILFFLGILTAIGALEATGLLGQLAAYMDKVVHNQSGIVLIIGLLSAVIDNVPLVAATMGMYGLEQYPTDHYFWEFLAYCAGTGGSVLIIGSAAGVAVMGIEKVDFFWYVKKISLPALLGYFAGAIAYMGFCYALCL